MPARDPDFDAAAVLAAWTPDLASDVHAPLIRELAAATRPPNRAGARAVAGILSGFVYWAEQNGRPVDADSLLAKPVIDNYVDSAPKTLAPATRKGFRVVLRRVARAREGRLDRRSPIGPSDLHKPYTPAEVDALLLWAANQPSPRRANALLSLLVLGLGAGLDGADVSAVRGTDIRQDSPDGPVLVNIRRDGAHRQVPVLARYETELLRLAAAAGTGWIVNPPSTRGPQEPATSSPARSRTPNPHTTPQASSRRAAASPGSATTSPQAPASTSSPPPAATNTPTDSPGTPGSSTHPTPDSATAMLRNAAP